VTFWCWGSVPLFHGSGLALDPDSALYISCQQKKFFLLSFFAYYFEIEGTFTSVLNVIKSQKEATRTGPGRRELTHSKQQPPAAARVEGDREPQNNSDPRVRNLRRFFGLLPWVYTSFYPRYSRGRAFSIS